MSKEEKFTPDEPEGSGSGSRFESADLDIGELENYIRKEVFEDEANIAEILTGRYGMARKETIGQVETGMTSIFDISKLNEKLGRDGVSKKEFEKRLDEYMRSFLKGKKSMRVGDVLGVGGKKVEIDEKDIEVEPVSGWTPTVVKRITIKTVSGEQYDLRILRVVNRNQRFRYEYILKEIGDSSKK